MAAGPLYSFGPFQLDAGARRLTRDGAALPVAACHLDVLAALVARAGTVVAKNALVEAAWPDVAVTDNSLEQAVSGLRRALGPAPGGDTYIQTLPRQGYRFNETVRTESARASDAELESLIAPHRAWVEGRAALESLDAGRIARARAAFETVLQASPADAIAHVGLANAYVMQFDRSGMLQWARQFGGKGDGDNVFGLAVGLTHLIVTGAADGALPGQTFVGGQDAFYRLYDFTGAEAGTREFGNGLNDFGAGAAADARALYIAGTKNGAALGLAPIGDNDAFVMKMAPKPLEKDEVQPGRAPARGGARGGRAGRAGN